MKTGKFLAGVLISVVATGAAGTSSRASGGVAVGDLVIAQAGGTGGSLGQQQKSISGPDAATSRTRRERASERPRSRSATPAPSRDRRRGHANYDGTWAFVAMGPGCVGNGSGVIIVTDGRIVGPNLSGQVSPSGAVSARSMVNGISIRSSGRFAQNSGSGSFRQSDGCAGNWTARKR